MNKKKLVELIESKGIEILILEYYQVDLECPKGYQFRSNGCTCFVNAMSTKTQRWMDKGYSSTQFYAYIADQIEIEKITWQYRKNRYNKSKV